MKGFIVWGSSTQEYTLRKVPLKVALCPVCKTPTEVNFIYRNKVENVYWINLGKGSVVSVDMLCLSCGQRFNLAKDSLVWALKVFKRAVGENSDSSLPDGFVGRAAARAAGESVNSYPSVDDLIRQTEREIERDKENQEQLAKEQQEEAEQTRRKKKRHEEKQRKIKNAKTIWQKMRVRLS